MKIYAKAELQGLPNDRIYILSSFSNSDAIYTINSWHVDFNC